MNINDAEKRILAWAIHKNPDEINFENNFKFQLTVKLYNSGLLSFRIVRYLLGINFNNLSETINNYFTHCNKLTDCENVLSHFQFIIEKKWCLRSIDSQQENNIQKTYQRVINAGSQRIQILEQEEAQARRAAEQQVEDARRRAAEQEAEVKRVAEAKKALEQEKVEKGADVNHLQAPRVHFMESIPKEAFFSIEGLSPKEVKELESKWEESPTRKGGDYFIRPSSSNDKEWRLVIYHPNLQRVLTTFTIKDTEDGNFQFSHSMGGSSQNINGIFSDLIQKIGKDLNLPQQSPSPPVLPTNFIESIPKEVFLSIEDFSPNEINELQSNWGKSPTRKEGDYFVRPSSSNDKEWRLVIYHPKLILNFTIKKTDDGRFQLMNPLQGKWSDLNGLFSNLIMQVEQSLQQFNMHLNPAVPNIIESIPKEAFLSSAIDAHQYNSLFFTWAASSDREVGDYFIRRSTDGKEWRLCIYTQADQLPTIIKIKETPNHHFQIVKDLEVINLTGSLSNLKNTIKDKFNIDLGNPKSPSLVNPARILTEPKIPLVQLQQELEDTEDVIGVRTSMAHKFLENVEGYRNSPHLVEYNHTEYMVLASNQVDISERKMISVGSSSKREMILLDPEQSPLLNKHYHEFVGQLEQIQGPNGAPLEMKTVASALTSYMRHRVFPSCKKSSVEADTDKLIADYKIDYPRDHVSMKKSNETIPVIPIDYFINQGIGVCRHHALVGAYMLDRLVKEHGGSLIPKGIAQQIRDNVTNGAHVWISFTEENGTKWHIDTLWDVKANMQNREAQDVLVKLYGQEVINNELKKSDFALQRINMQKRNRP